MFKKQTWNEKRAEAQKRLDYKREEARRLQEQIKAHTTAGLSAFTSDRYEDAMREFFIAIKLGSKDSNTHTFYASASFHVEKCKSQPVWGNVEKAFSKSVAMDKKSSLPHYAIAEYYKFRNWRKSEFASLKEAARIIEEFELPAAREEYDASLKSEEALGKLMKEGAKRQYASAIKTLSDIYSSMGFCLLNMEEKYFPLNLVFDLSSKNFAEAEKYFLKSNSLCENANANQGLARISYKKKEYDKVIDLTEKVLKSDSAYFQARWLKESAEKAKNRQPMPRLGKVFMCLYGASIFFFILAMDNAPNWYYALLKLVICGICTFSAVKYKSEWAKWFFGGLAVLYNPIFPLPVGDSDVWVALNIGTAVFMWTAFFFERKHLLRTHHANTPT